MLTASAALWVLIIASGHNVTTVPYQDEEACQKAAAAYNSHYHGGQKDFYHAACTRTASEG